MTGEFGQQNAFKRKKGEHFSPLFWQSSGSCPFSKASCGVKWGGGDSRKYFGPTVSPPQLRLPFCGEFGHLSLNLVICHNGILVGGVHHRGHEWIRNIAVFKIGITFDKPSFWVSIPQISGAYISILRRSTQNQLNLGTHTSCISYGTGH